jgi:hypothetical protein
MNTTTTKIAGEAMTDDEKIALAAKFGIGPYSGLSFARALLASNPAVLQKPYGWVGAGNYWTADELTAKQVSIRTDTPMVPVYVATTAPAQSCGDAEQADEAVTGGAVDSGHVDTLEWHWSTSDEGPMYACGTDDVTESLAHALYESGIATFGEDQTSIFLCRFRPLRINWEHHAEWLLEHIDDTVIDHVAEDAVPTEKTNVDELATALAAIVKVDASVAYDQCEFAPGDEKYETALLRVRNDATRAKDSK